MPQPAEKRLVTEATVASHVATEVTTPGTATATALSATIGTQVATAVAPKLDAATAVRSYGRNDGLYMPSSLSWLRWRTRLTQTLAKSRQAHIAVVGDSIGYGAGATGNSNPKHRNSWPGQLREMLSSQYGNAGTGVVLAQKNTRLNPAYDPRFAYGTGVSDFAFGFHKEGAWKIDGPGAAAANHVSFTPDVPVSEFDVWNLRSTGGANRAQVDAEAVVTFRNYTAPNPGIAARAGDNAGHYVTTIPAPALGTHTLNVWPDSAAGAYPLYLTAVEGRVPTMGTFRVSNASISGKNLWSLFGAPAAATNDETNAFFGLPLIDMLRSDLLVIALGINDWLTNVSVADAKADLKTLVQRQRLTGTATGGGTYAGGDALLVWNPRPDTATLAPSGGGTATWDQYREMFYQVADEEDVPLLDLGGRWNNYATGNSKGTFADTIHPSDLGSQDIAAGLRKVILSAAA